MKVKITENCAGSARSFTVGQTPILDDSIGNDLIGAGYAELIDADIQPGDPVTTSPPPPAVKKTADKS